MRFMIQVRASEDMETGVFPPNAKEMFDAMDAFNQELVRDGWMLAADGLQPSSKGARIRWTDGKPRVIDGPFAEAKELIAGYWLIQAPSREAVIERFKRCPPPTDLRQGRSRSARSTTPVMRAREEKWIAEQQAKPSRA